MSEQLPFIWETHGIHVGTGKDQVQHGIDDIEEVVRKAASLGFPSLSFIIHSPRLTGYRYQNERDTNVKFIRGDSAYFAYAPKMKELRDKYRNVIIIRFGVELEWMGSGVGLQWNRSKLFQANGLDHVIGSVHFSREGLPYDGSQEDTDRLIKARGGVEAFWDGYLNEVIEMIDSSWEMIHVVGHLDLPKLFAPVPEPLVDLEGSSHPLARRMRTILEMISDLNLALDLNLSGVGKGCGVYPDASILRRAWQLRIPLAIGSDCHDLEDLGREYSIGLELARQAGYQYYVSFSRGIPEKRSLSKKEEGKFRILNLAIETLKLRFEEKRRQQIPRLSFGGGFRDLLDDFPEAVSLGDFHALRVRRDDRSITLTDDLRAAGLTKSATGDLPGSPDEDLIFLYSHHTDTPGTLSILFNTLASEGINVETAYLNSLADGTATAFLTLSQAGDKIQEAMEFVLGTAPDRFLKIEPEVKIPLPPLKKAPVYLLQVDGVELPMPLSRHMIVTVHHNRPGVLLILLSALSSRNVNVIDLQLGNRGDRGYAVLGVSGDEREVTQVLPLLGPQYIEASQIILTGLEDL